MSRAGLAVTLRPYQQDAIDSIYRWFGTNDGNPLIVVPTGGGKSLIIGGFVHSVLAQWPSERILVLTHVRELIEQNHAQILRCWPDAPAGIYSAGIGRRDHEARVLVAGIQSVYRQAARIGWADLVIIDEAHLIPKSGVGMYRQLLADLKSMNSDLKLIGLTATPFRTGEGRLDRGDDRLFDGVAYDCDVRQLIADGYLSAVRSKAGTDGISTAGVHVRMGEFVEGEVAAAAMADGLVEKNVAEIVRRGQERRSWLVFCCSIDHANRVADELQRVHGVACATVFGDTDSDTRRRVVADFRAGTLRCVVNVNVLTTGFDAPGTDLIALLRPTMSPVLYVQMVGRGLRLSPGKADCLVLDFGENVKRHGPIDAIKVREPRAAAAGPAPVLARECPVCQSLVPIASLVCEECGFQWQPVDRAASLAETPGEDEILSGIEPRQPIERWDVQAVHWRRHEKPGKTPTLCVEYEGGFQQRVREWVCFDHAEGSYPHRRALSWWSDHGGHDPAPGSVFEAMARRGETLPVVGVTVDLRGEWPELRGVRFSREPGIDTTDYTTSQPIDVSELPF